MPPRRPLVVVVADDDAATRDLLIGAFTRDGHSVQAAASGTELLALLLDGEADVVVTDVSMPGHTGLEVCRRALAAGAGPPFIFLTAFPDAETRREADALGALAILDKPFDLDDLRELVNTLP